MLVGLDVIGDYLTEINVTSPTGMQEIAKQTGFNVSAKMIDAIEKAIQKTKQPNSECKLGCLYLWCFLFNAL